MTCVHRLPLREIVVEGICVGHPCVELVLISEQSALDFEYTDPFLDSGFAVTSLCRGNVNARGYDDQRSLGKEMLVRVSTRCDSRDVFAHLYDEVQTSLLRVLYSGSIFWACSFGSVTVA